MSESAQHLQLVNLIIDEVISMVGDANRCFIMSDAADGFALSPRMEEGYRPDVYYQYQNSLIIGEAKTSDDVASMHSKMQYESYLKKCSLFKGNAVFLVAVHGRSMQLSTILLENFARNIREHMRFGS